MGLLFKGITEVLSEACKTEDVNYTDDCVSEEEFFEEIEELEELEDDIEYTEEMVNVISQETEHGVRYMVEYCDLVRLMNSNEYTERQALARICECNMLSYADTYVVIESSEDIIESIREAKDSAKSAEHPVDKANRKKKLDSASKAIRNLKNKGIKILKKKSKGLNGRIRQ